MKTQRLALLLLGVALGLPLSMLAARAIASRSGILDLHGRVAEAGGWIPDNLTAQVGVPLRLRLTSDDVVHGFAVGQSPATPIDVEPGRPVETTLTFARPGRYVFYCTRWCGPNHWRMRGTIEVSGPEDPSGPQPQSLYLRLGLDLDAPHPAENTPDERPSAQRGDEVRQSLSTSAIHPGDVRVQSPAQVWQRLRDAPPMAALTDQQVWDLVASVWRANTSPEAIEQGRALYAANCAACHGETGAGDGVMADSIVAAAMPGSADPVRPADFTDPERMLGASPALLYGKISRGGMGTGMPYWGPIFTDEQIWNLVDYLWTFQFGESR